MEITEELKNELLERMLAWDGRQAKFSYLEWKKATKPPKPPVVDLRTPEQTPSDRAWVRKLHEKTAALIVRDGRHCHWCGRECTVKGGPSSPLFPTRDHLVRKADGGPNGLRNLVLACRKCNNSRHAKGWKPPIG